MALPPVDSIEAVTLRFKQLLEKAQRIKSSASIEPSISITELLSDDTPLLSDNIQNQTTHNTVAETAAKRLLHHFVATTTIDNSEFVQVWNLLDIVLICSERGQCDGLLIFYLAEDLLDSQSIDGCRRVFDYLESRRERLVAGDFLQATGASKRIVVLRFCNELLRRLSRAEDAVFCGRVFIFLFQTFPLGDKSSVNSRGEFHVENATVFEENPPAKGENADEMEVDSESKSQPPTVNIEETPVPEGTKYDPTKDNTTLDSEVLYPIFWTLQQSFSNPPRLFNDERLLEFKRGVKLTLNKFRAVPKVVQAKAGENRGVKRKQDEQEDQFASTYNPKYLTSRDLFKLELSDLAFQRHILVQALILLDFLLSLTERSKDTTQKWLAQVNSQNRAVQYGYTLSAEDAEWALGIKNDVANYLQELPDGKFYHRMVDTVLSRDKNWVRWKMENCPPIAQPPVPPQDFQDAKTSAQRACANKRLRAAPMGSLNLSFLSDSASNSGLEGLKSTERYKVPSAESFVNSIKGDELDLEMAMTDEEKQGLTEAKASKTWRALRIAAQDKLSLFDRIDDGRQLEQLFRPAAGEEAGNEAAETRVDGSAGEQAEEQRAEQGSATAAEARARRG
ncbi:uncharacterized protein K452DRAFT_295661 [Aplosporella prunicola CBS 121167]|uniref:Nuclear matrix protein n=1 Tax=Aplosporella prunicola CBS 121167 TaxID=1176127 RepID=A0A6A6BNV4_9PEZI|nr:uncharacterized protein K452DRAFT_295661 [Aplosporella prunicola CBS 121167]KAF2145113.1 hypothetical protein K452DRAFT_295661 [Aplosporella prunicola CBS 121167]